MREPTTKTTTRASQRRQRLAPVDAQPTKTRKSTRKPPLELVEEELESADTSIEQEMARSPIPNPPTASTQPGPVQVDLPSFVASTREESSPTRSPLLPPEGQSQFLPPEVVEQRVTQGLQELEQKTAHIQQLQAELEFAMHEFRLLSDTVHRDRQMLQAAPTHNTPTPPISPTSEVHGQEQTGVASWTKEQIGSVTLSPQPTDVLRAETAKSTAEMLRGFDRKPPRSRRSTATRPWYSRLLPRQYQTWLWDLLQVPEGATAIVSNGLTWVVGAAVVRVGLQILLAAHPLLWLPAAFLLITPALLAAYHATIDPKSGFVLGYRLLLIMAGLLLGGKL